VDRASSSKRRALWALLLCAPAATLGAASALLWFPGTLGQVVYSILRAWMALLPLLWRLRVERRPLSWSPVAPARRTEAVVVAAVLCIVFAGTILLVNARFGGERIDAVELRRVVESFGLTNPLRFVAFGLYLSLVNSLIEEYVWRGFVHERCAELVGARAAVPLGAALFTAHHVVVFVVELGPALGLLASFGVFLAGCIWSLARLRYRSIWPAWPSHVVADAVGLFIAWRLAFGA